MPAAPLKVIVVGAGTGGMCLAHGLRRAGIDVSVHERDRTRTGGLHGYRVGISPNGARALRACLSPELFATFVATTGAPYDVFTMFTERFRVLVGVDAAEMPASGPDAAPQDRDHNVSRATLRQVLFTGMEDVIHFDRRFTGYTERDDGRVTAHFDDGGEVTGDLLVGADGANSAVRRQYLPHARQRETGLVAVGGRVALTDGNRDLLPDRAMRGLSMLFDRDGRFGITHPMRMPWDDDRVPRTTMPHSDPAVLAAWPGLGLVTTTDHVTWGLSMSRRDVPEDTLRRRGADLVALALDRTRHWDPRWRELVATSDPEASLALSIRTSEPIPAWEPSGVTLLGDAVHTMTPGRGAGANTALRDARELTDRLVRVRDGELDLRAAVGEYEELMRRYSALAVAESLEFMDDDDTPRRPVLGPLSVLARRTGMRVVDRVPALKRRMVRDMQRVRDSELV